MKNYLLIFLILTIAGLLGLSYYYSLDEGVAKDNLPQYAQRTPQVQMAYEYAVENPDLFKNIPCYCNCYRLGHRSVEDCFVSEFKEDNKVIFDSHGANCGTCYSIVLDSKALFEQGKSIQEVRNFIDNKYSQYGLPTSTPLP